MVPALALLACLRSLSLTSPRAIHCCSICFVIFSVVRGSMGNADARVEGYKFERARWAMPECLADPQSILVFF